MSPPPRSPFTGISLSGQGAPSKSGPDQRLFAGETPTAKPMAPSHQATNLASKEPIKQGTLKTRNLGSLESSGSAGPTPPPLFDLAETPYRNNTFSFTDGELDAIEDIKIELRRKHDLRTTKNNLVRCAIHLLVEDYRREKARSSVVHRLRGAST